MCGIVAFTFSSPGIVATTSRGVFEMTDYVLIHGA
jgi:hypothetical protein